MDEMNDELLSVKLIKALLVKCHEIHDDIFLVSALKDITDYM